MQIEKISSLQWLCKIENKNYTIIIDDELEFWLLKKYKPASNKLDILNGVPFEKVLELVIIEEKNKFDLSPIIKLTKDDLFTFNLTIQNLNKK